jgi:hypothetical protein
LRRELAWLLVCKALALVLVWALFFSPAHRPDISAAAASRHFALELPSGAQPAGRP